MAQILNGESIALPPRDDATDKLRQAHNQERAMALWAGSCGVEGSPAERYLVRRAIGFLAGSPVLRFRGDTSHLEGGKYPAMIALVTGADGKPIAVHRTYLRPDGTKAKVELPKLSLGPVWGGAIRLSVRVDGVPLVIGEGIETAASAGRLMGCPAWAAISAGNLAKGLVLPPEVQSVCIAADPGAVGRKAAHDAWLRWKAEGRSVTIATPDGSGDFNDILVAREMSNG